MTEHAKYWIQAVAAGVLIVAAAACSIGLLVQLGALFGAWAPFAAGLVVYGVPGWRLYERVREDKVVTADRHAVVKRSTPDVGSIPRPMSAANGATSDVEL